MLALPLTRMGFDVHTVGNGTEGIAAGWGHHPSLVMVAVHLPDMDGLDVAWHIRQRSAAPILFITTRLEPGKEIPSLASGAIAYLVKPFRPRQLTRLVNQLCPVGPLTAQRQYPGA